jgi:uncharacterized protein DUF4105
VKRLGWVLISLLVAMTTFWCVGMLVYATPGAAWLGATLAIAFAAATVLAFAVFPRRRRTLLAFGAVFAALLVWYFSLRPSNERDWQPEVAVTPWAQRDGDLVTIHGVRNFVYRAETDFDPHWETRRYDLNRLSSADVIAVYWAGKAIAHIMVSFGFEGDDYLTMSIETRKERGESYSALGGFFRRYELVYIVGDERDLIGVRTTYRNPQEDVYVYRLPSDRERIRRVFLDYIDTMNDMRQRPRFYNTLLTNCTTGMFLHARVNPDRAPFSWKILLSGYVPAYLYELGRIDTRLPFAEMERRSLVNKASHAAGYDAAFSRRIRDALPAGPAVGAVR